MEAKTSRIILIVFATIALLFGLATIFSGGRVLFGGVAAREAVGNYVPMVVWFNFIAGFAYVAAAVGMFAEKRWAVRLAWIIAAVTALVFLAFVLLALTGSPFEMRTVAAMVLRTGMWAGLAWFAGRRSDVR